MAEWYLTKKPTNPQTNSTYKKNHSPSATLRFAGSKPDSIFFFSFALLLVAMGPNDEPLYGEGVVEGSLFRLPDDYSSGY